MPLWIEIHCDIKAQAPKDFYGQWCHTDGNNNPAMLMHDDRVSMMKGLHFLEKLAREQGWRKNRANGWICPNCQITLANEKYPG